MFALLGDARSDAVRESKAVMALETRLAAASMPEIEQRNPGAIYHPVTLESAQVQWPHVNWRALFASLGHPEIRSLNVAMPGFFQCVDRELARTPLADWKAYLRLRLIDSYAPYLSKAFVDEDFRLTSALQGARQLQERWLRVLAAEDEALGFAIGQLYVAQKFPPAAKEAAEALVLRIRDALRTDLETLAWMTPATRQAAQQKLDLMELRVGYPDRWRDYSGLEIDRGPYVLNVLRANRIRAQATARQDRQAGRSQRVDHDTANGQCLLRPIDEQFERSGGNAAAAIFRRELVRCRELRFDRLNHRP